tara:strand:+ start:117 stop:1016 length:900 start_codon:yes stop_codon:yes gene_type:complete
MTKNFIDINDFKRNQIDEIVLLAKKIKKNPKKYSTICKNKTLASIFEKQSLRTRLSFSVGMKKLGGDVLELNSKEIGFDNKRELPKDILNVLSQYIDCLMIRNNNHKQLLELGNQKIIPIINGLTDYSHPCQILGDFLTIQENFKNYQNIQLTWIGDYNNVLTSLLHLQNIYLFKLNVVIPKQIMRLAKKELLKYQNKNLKVLSDPLSGSINSNCIMTDVWLSMGEKNTNKSNYFKGFTVNKKIINSASKDVIFMHCLPAKRGKEVSSDVLDGERSVVLQQAQNRMFIQQAILIYVLKN